MLEKFQKLRNMNYNLKKLEKISDKNSEVIKRQSDSEGRLTHNLIQIREGEIENPCGKKHGSHLCSDCLISVFNDYQTTTNEEVKKKSQMLRKYFCINRICFIQDFSSKLSSYEPMTQQEYEGIYQSLMKRFKQNQLQRI